MLEVKIPRPGESINEVVLSKWFVEDGSYVNKNQEIGEIESDKATLPLIAPESGKITFQVKIGSTIAVGSIACSIDTSVAAPAGAKEKKAPKEEVKSPVQQKAETPSKEVTAQESKAEQNIKVTPLAQKMMDENRLNVEDILNGLKKIGKEEVTAVLNLKNAPSFKAEKKISRDDAREPMSQLRKKLSKRLVAVKNETAMLTTFNEADMSEIMGLRNKYQKVFAEKHGIKLGFMSLFAKAAAIALQQYPKVNSMIDGEDIISHSYVDIGIAVQTEKGLMVPVLRNVESQSLADIERNIAHLAEKGRSGRLSIDEMTGGTFTITNGGVFGSLLSTPIINPPQAAILGMHNIVERPVAVNGKVEIRPMMYLALSYDHRLIDGKDSVSFLVKIKELVESPYKMLLEGQSPDKLLLEI